jgi:two-component sensor histidine kinase
MEQIGELDLPDRLARYVPIWATQLGLGLLCAAIAIALRAPIDRVAPGIGPFVLGFPLMLVATLFGRWQAGLVTAVITILHGWFFVLPTHHSLALQELSDRSRLTIVLFGYGTMLVIAESFRSAAYRAMRESERRLAERDLLLRELDHRVKNNFAMVTSLLDLQLHRSDDPATQDALSTALGRVESIARAHGHLYSDGATITGTDMHTYLGELCGTLADTLPPNHNISFDFATAPTVLPRDRAVAIGLVVNELVTNATKHAFIGRAHGTIRISFAAYDNGWRLIVEDDGIGLPAETRGDRPEGLGRRLVDAFARQAHGKLKVESDGSGTRFTLDLAP